MTNTNLENNIRGEDGYNVKKTRAVEYVRYSDHNQDDGMSIEYQKEACEKFIAEKGWVLTRAYIDAAKTGRTTANRDNFLRMVQDAKRGEFDVIVVYKFSRIFRNSYEAHMYEYEFSKFDVQLVSATEPIDSDTIEGKLMKGIIHAFNEFTSDTIAAHVTSSMVTAAQKGIWKGGVTPFGYEAVPIDPMRPKDGKKYAINKEEAEIVRLIFDMWANGFTQAQIQRTCQDRGYLSRNGKPLGSTTISAILRNDAYIGVYRFKAKRYDEIVLEDNHDPIIDQKTWDLVQYRLNNPTTSFPKPKMKGQRIYALTGKIECTCCGNHFVGSTKAQILKSTGEKKDYSYYTCAGKKNQRVCKAKDIRKDKLEEYVFAKIKEHILNEEAIENISKEVYKLTGDTASEREEAIARYKAKKKELNQKIESTFEVRLSTTNETAKAFLDKKIDELGKELDEVNNKLAQYNLVDDTSLTVKKIADYLNELLEYTESGDPALLKIVADNLVDKIVVDTEDIKVFLNVLLHGYIRDNESVGEPTWNISLTVKAKEFNEKGKNQYTCEK